jgi:hypothetical protein
MSQNHSPIKEMKRKKEVTCRKNLIKPKEKLTDKVHPNKK